MTERIDMRVLRTSMMSGVSKYIQLKLGDDNGKNCGAIAVRIPGTQAANLLSRARYRSVGAARSTEPSWFFFHEREKLAKPKRSSDITINGRNSEQE